MTPRPVDDGGRRSVWLLAFGQTFGWASIFYIYGALLVWVEADTGWDRTSLSFGLSLALLVSAVSVSFAGRFIDRGKGSVLLGAGAGLGGVALLGLSQVTSLAGWYLAWALIGLAMAASFYDMCFAFLTRNLHGQARRAITHVTLVAGFASTLAFPLGDVLARSLGWRGAVLGFAAIQLLVTMPLNIFGTRGLSGGAASSGTGDGAPPGHLRATLSQRPFWLLAGAFGLAAMTHTMLVTYFIPVFTGLGAAHKLAVAAASLVGPFQVAGRLILMALGQRIGTGLATRGAIAGSILACLILIGAGIQPEFIFIFAAIQGASVGMLSILRPVLIADVLGRKGFGVVSGAIATAPLLTTAAAPVIGAVVLQAGGIRAFLVVCTGLAIGALVFALALRSNLGR